MRNVFSKALMAAALLAGGTAMAATPDGLITTKAKLQLMTTSNVRSGDVHVDTNDGVVVLYGKVPTMDQKQRAEAAVAKLDGVRDVKNLLQVVSKPEEKRIEARDDVIKDNVVAALKADVALKDSDISVKSVDKGTVLLAGKAASISDHYRAVALADGVKGVTQVATEVATPDAYSNQEKFITVTESVKDKAKRAKADIKNEAKDMKADLKAETNDGKNSLDDTRISAAVKLRLWTTSNVPSTQINVDTSNRVVTLFGIVPNAASKTLAEAEASKVSGVAKVQNQLQVVAPSQKDMVVATDKNLQANLKVAFDTRPELKDVSTEVKAGVVRLTGTVYSTWDKLNAIRIARFTSGVKGVEDALMVKDLDGAEKAQF